MYRDEGYGENWQPAAANNARRIDPYTRSCVVLGSLFAIGFVLIIIVVLSLIPIYISHSTSTGSTNIQAAKMTIYNYKLQFRSPTNDFDPNSILSQSSNRQGLQAALTSLIQNDGTIAGSIVEINSASQKSTRKRRDASVLISIICDLYLISSKPCSTITCLSQYQSHANSFLTNINRTISNVLYQAANSAVSYWIDYQLPATIQSNITSVLIDPKSVTSMLETLMFIDKTQNQSMDLTNTTTPTSNG